MKAKNSLAVLFICLLVILAVAVGCSKKPNDAQIIGEVATKIQADPNVQVKTIGIQSTDGVVTLTGQVGSDSERAAAATDAGQIAGVKTVVNNLTVAQAAVAPVEEAAPVDTKSAKASARKTPSKSSSNAVKDTVSAAPTQQAQSAPAPALSPSAPAAPPKPTTVTVPDGTQLSIRLIDPLDSEKNQVGDSFRATVNHSVNVGDQVAIPSGAEVMGRVVDVKGATHFSGQSVLAVELTQVAFGGKRYELRTEEFRRQGAARGKNTAVKTGGGAAVGAIIGAIAGGGKGAAIGAAAGGATGAGVNAVTKGQKIQLPSESVMTFRLVDPVTVTPAGNKRPAGDRPELSDRSDDSGN